MSKFDQEISQAVSELGQAGIFNKNVVLFGAGNNSRKLYEEINYRGYSIMAVIDNNRRLADSLFYGYRIQYAPDFLKEKHIDTIYLILSLFYTEIKKQMELVGLIENIDFYPVVDLDIRTLDQSNNIFNKDIEQLIRGMAIYKKLIDMYGEDTEFLINPATSIGDIYLMSFYAETYLNKHKNSIFILGSKVLVQLADSLKIGECIYVTISDILDLIKLAQVFGFEKNNLKLLHTGVVHFRIWSRMLTYLNFTWMEHFKELFELSVEVKPRFKILESNKSQIDKAFIKYNLKKGKTILLSPYANTVRQIPLRYWDELAQVLINNGFSVCTNIGKSNEIPIKNTTPVFIDVKNFVSFVEEAGYFIGLRSGLCDLLLTCKAKKIVILYSDEIFDLISVYDFFSLKKMGCINPIIEEVIHKDDNSLIHLNVYLEEECD